jgi:hypothetical protein
MPVDQIQGNVNACASLMGSMSCESNQMNQMPSLQQLVSSIVQQALGSYFGQGSMGSSPYGGMGSSPYCGVGSSPYCGVGSSPYGGVGSSPYGGMGSSPYGGVGSSPYDGMGSSPYCGVGSSPYGGAGSSPYGGAGSSPYGGMTLSPCRGGTSHPPHRNVGVTANGNDLNVSMGRTTLSTSKSNSGLSINTTTRDGHQISMSSTGDPHATLSVDGKQIAAGTYKNPLTLDDGKEKITMIPDAQNGAAAPYLNEAVIQQADGSMYKLKNLGQSTSSKPTEQEVTNPFERARLQGIINNSQTLAYAGNGQVIDSGTGQSVTNDSINGH